jgi:SAM-dependent methyltransferase
MVKFPDISEYYKFEKAIIEEHDWYKTKPWGQQPEYRYYADVANKLIKEKKIKSILEIGCGSGLVPTELPGEVLYMGVDKNPLFLEWARNKNIPSRQFIEEDVRNISKEWLEKQNYCPDSVMTFAFLKHFGLHEWDGLVGQLLSLAPNAIIETQTSDHNFDNGTEFHHVFVTDEHLKSVVEKNQHKIVAEIDIFKTETPHPVCAKIIVTESI